MPTRNVWDFGLTNHITDIFTYFYFCLSDGWPLFKSEANIEMFIFFKKNKFLILPKNDLGIHHNPHENPSDNSAVTKLFIPTFIWNLKGPWTGKTILEKQETHASWFQMYHKPIVFKTVWYWCKDRHINQWNKTEPRSRPLHIWLNDFQQGCQDHSIEKRVIFNKWCYKTGNLHTKMNLDSYVIQKGPIT
jgi:hypothetical protein